jgi:hypothetical protein
LVERRESAADFFKADARTWPVAVGYEQQVCGLQNLLNQEI